ncbi:MAG: hypothetical protein M3H12_03715 [Chromatiales bacterium]
MGLSADLHFSVTAMSSGGFILHRKQRAFPAKAVNCSMLGICFEAESLTLPIGVLVEVDLRRYGRNWRMMGIVVHTSQSGIGIMFRNHQPEFYEAVVAGQVVAKVEHQPVVEVSLVSPGLTS